MTLTIKSRSSWQARAPKYRRALSTTHNGWFWHWLGNGFPAAASDEQILQSIQRYHMDTKGWSDVAYSFAVGRDGDAYELRGWDIAGGHTQGYNSTSMAIVFLIGEGETPTPEMFRTAYAIMAMRPEITLLRTHRSVGTTQCPGDDIAAEVTNPQHKDRPPMLSTMTPSAAEIHVDEAYSGILGRKADATGRAFWIEKLTSGEWTLADMRHNFLVSRLAADKAVIEALSKMTKGTPVDTTVVAEQVYRMFLDDLIALSA